jgi:hypothetical protein
MREMITVHETGHELRVQVLDGHAYVAIVATDGSEDADAWARSVSLPARRLHALVRAAWADDQYGAVGPLDPPLRPPEEPWDGPEPEVDPYREERLRFGWRDDWPDEEPDLGRTAAAGELLPFPRAAPERSTSWDPLARWRDRPARWGLPWSAEDDAALRQAWLGADPAADRLTLLAQLATRFERTVGGVHQRLHRVSCDPARPGRTVFRPIWPVPEEHWAVSQDAPP